jgi:hypothetical protein
LTSHRNVADPDPDLFGSVSFSRIRIIFHDPDPFLYVSDSNPDPDPTLLSISKLTVMEDETMYACCLAPRRPINKENQAKIYNIKKCCFRCIYLFETARIWIRIKKSDPDASQSEKPVPDPYQIVWIHNTVS